MKNQVKICLETAWLVAAVAILFMGTPMCVSNGEACVQAGNTMLTAMFLISFPTGVLFFLITSIFVDPGRIYQPSDFVTAWFIMMCGGLLQWFLMVPGLFEGRPGLTTLNLKTSATLPSVGSQDGPLPLLEITQPAPVAKTIVPETTPPAQSKPVRLVSKRIRTPRKSIKSTAAFDRAGRTPLERVIDHL
jgi:hypothetical protein